jgi:hypothetical protein
VSVCPRRRWVDNIKMGLLEIGYGGLDWSSSGQGQEGSSCECDYEPSGSSGCTIGGLSSSSQFIELVTLVS